MAFGDYLKKRLTRGDFLQCEDKKSSNKAFWIVLRDTAVEELRLFSPQKIDSDIAIRIYYSILLDHMDDLPDFICEILPSNNQERFRVANRNLFSSNAFHPDGLANQKGIIATQSTNSNRKGDKIIFQWRADS